MLPCPETTTPTTSSGDWRKARVEAQDRQQWLADARERHRSPVAVVAVVGDDDALFKLHKGDVLRAAVTVDQVKVDYAKSYYLNPNLEAGVPYSLKAPPAWQAIAGLEVSATIASPPPATNPAPPAGQ